MDKSPKSIDDLYRMRAEADKRRQEIDAEIKRLERLIEAAEMLKSAGILEVAGARQLPRQHSHLPYPTRANLRGLDAQRVQSRDAAVMSAIKGHYPNRVFTVPDITPLVDVSKRSIKRALDDMIDRGEIVLVEQGFKRRPTKYRLAENQEKKESEEQAQNSPEQ